MHSCIKKIALLLLVMVQVQAGLIDKISLPSWISRFVPELSPKQTAYIGIGLGVAAGVSIGAFLLYKKFSIITNQQSKQYVAPLLPVPTPSTIQHRLPDMFEQSFAQQLSPTSEFMNFTDWNNYCQNLSPLIITKIEEVEIHYKHQFDLEQLKLTAQDIQKVLDYYFHQLYANDHFTNNKNWANYEKTENLLQSLQNEQHIFDPYVEKLIVKPNAIISFHGDLHGDIHSLNNYLIQLKDKGYLDPKNPFKIIHNNFYMVFLGDYVDRGWYGAEVIYTIVRLKIENPDKVILVRGNHEDEQLNKDQNGFFGQLQKRFGDQTDPLYSSIQKFYETLPLALYLGSGTREHKDFIVCCHGGIEFGFDPLLLLNHESAHAYTKLGTINRFAQIKKLESPQNEHLLAKFIQTNKNKIKNFNDLLNNIACTHKIYTDPYLLAFDAKNIITMKQSPLEKCQFRPLFIGFQWNDYEVNQNLETKYVPQFIKNNTSRGFIIGKTFNEVMLILQSDKQNTVRGVFRAHQHDHSTQNEMMRRILNCDNVDHECNAGVARLWQNPKTFEAGHLWDNIVCTFNVTPHTNYQAAGFNYDTYGLLTIAEKFQDWQLEVIRQEQSSK